MSTRGRRRPRSDRVTAAAPRGGRRYVPFRMAWSGYHVVVDMAATETEGDVSEMIRTLLREAIAARLARSPR